MTQKKIIIYAIIIAAGIAVANAQTPQDTIKALQQELQRVQTEIPVYFLCGSGMKNSSRHLYYVKGFQKGSINLDSRKKVFPDWVIVFAIMPRQEEIKKK